MSDQHKSRTERREEQRELRKDYTALIGELRQEMAQRPAEGFKEAIGLALINLDKSDSPNKLIALQMVVACVAAYDRQDHTSARLLLYLAGAVVDPNLTLFVFHTVMGAQQMFETTKSALVLPSGPPQG